jgi:polyhydroxyalkanoate synthesis regulator phasin
MTDDLVTRLRIRDCGSQTCGDERTEAADRIEELEQKLIEADKQIKVLEEEVENLEYEMCELENNYDR